ncbi:hypothetical protein ZEAMMB73_Zm00001d027745 [Zea mays]|uniref:Uncharacterized protein n=1 Tax=Zea mays TaxID=4577 RepID=A0A1D6JP73_MAIZE|nr:hypothetical protein ZEAMMB73_Zm00001d027745 [Zea mays]
MEGVLEFAPTYKYELGSRRYVGVGDHQGQSQRGGGRHALSTRIRHLLVGRCQWRSSYGPMAPVNPQSTSPSTARTRWSLIVSIIIQATLGSGSMVMMTQKSTHSKCGVHEGFELPVLYSPGQSTSQSCATDRCVRA